MSDKEKKPITVLYSNEKPWENPEKMKETIVKEADKQARMINFKFDYVTEDDGIPQVILKANRKVDKRNKKRYNPDGTLKLNCDWYIEKFGKRENTPDETE